MTATANPVPQSAAVADACLREGVDVRLAPAGLVPVLPGHRVAGRVLPVRHGGSVDVFLEAIERAQPGEILVIDNAGRLDEACIGDLVALEAQGAGLAAILVWGLHRDTAALRAIGLPVWSHGALPSGPRRAVERAADALEAARFGPWTLTRADIAVADDDGAIFLPVERAERLLAVAREIEAKERAQAEAAKGGRSLREQFRFREYLARREKEPELTFRAHLKGLSASVEE